ncbi:MAG TPA: carboxypeptidase regulatory-like domain-containing protein, partial [Terriglobales bacterium]|nr:carboxypeptidase regulatory-like domain-containing protein [Terriglobales bacterium]
MGVLRKLVSGRLQAQAAGPHPDPDVLAAFAENALLQAERAQLLQHLGACHNCREILYLAAPDSAAAQQVLSYQPKRRSWMMFRWGALAASVVIVGVAVTARHSLLEKSTLSSQSRDMATAPVSASPKMAQEKAPADVESARDRLAPAPQPVAKERPELKHMTAKPQAGMQFDDSDQVRVSTGPVADQAKKSRNDNLTINGRTVAGPTNQVTPAASAAVAGAVAKDKSYVVGGLANSNALSAQISGRGNLDGTIVDASGAAIGNAKVSTLGPAGEKTATSDPEGRFVFSALTPGTYSIKAEASGFKSSEVTNLAVVENEVATLGVRLDPGSAAETVQLSAAAVPMNKQTRADAPPEP